MLNHETDVIGNSQNAKKTSNVIVLNPIHVALPVFGSQSSSKLIC